MYVYPFRFADQSLVLQVWRKGSPIPGFNPDEWRTDVCGTRIQFSAHGNTNSRYGWEIDHIVPESRGGPQHLANLQPLYWETNRKKADSLSWSC